MVLAGAAADMWGAVYVESSFSLSPMTVATAWPQPSPQRFDLR